MKKKIIWIIVFIAFFITLVFTDRFINNKAYNNVEKKGNITENEVIDTEKNKTEAAIKVTSDNFDETEAIIKVTSDNFDEVVLNSEKTVLVDFYADWCPPCKLLAPVFDEVARENTNDNLIFVRINVDEEAIISRQYGIQSIPTLVLIKNGQEVDRVLGYVEKDEILNLLNN